MKEIDPYSVGINKYCYESDIYYRLSSSEINAGAGYLIRLALPKEIEYCYAIQFSCRILLMAQSNDVRRAILEVHSNGSVKKDQVRFQIGVSPEGYAMNAANKPIGYFKGVNLF